MNDIMPIGNKKFGELDDISLGFDDNPALPNLSVNVAAFMQPVHLELSAWHEHVPFAFWLTGAHRPRTFVELGTHYGVSYFAFCQAVERLRLSTRCYAVDSWQGDEHAGLYGGDVYEKVSAHNARFYSRFSALMQTTFDEGVAFFADGEIDLLHIDGYHTLEAVKHDFETWLPKLSERGLVVLHDSNERKSDFGVYQFVEELREIYPCFEFAHGHGLTIVGVGPDQSPSIRRLFEADRDEAKRRNVQEVFARLGKACANEYAAGTLQSEVAALSSERNRAAGEIDRIQAHLAQIEAEAASERENSNETVAAARNQLAHIERENAALRRDTDGAAETLKTVTRGNMVLREQLATLERHKRENVAVQERLHVAAASLQKAEHELASRDRELRRLLRSSSWRMTAPVRGTLSTLRFAGRKTRRLIRSIAFHSNGRPRKLVRKLLGGRPASRSTSGQIPGFDPEWYASAYPDVATFEMDAATHYLRHGKGEGRHPSRESAEFDRDAYVATYPDVATTGMDPYVHYCLHGKSEGRHYPRMVARDLPRALVEARPPGPVELVPVPLTDVPPAARGATPRGTMICLSHVAPYPPRAGNEYRLHRLLSWLRQQEWRVILLYCALPGEEPSAEKIRALAGEYDDFVVVGRDGRLLYHLSDPVAAKAVADLKSHARDFSGRLDEENSPAARLLGFVRLFCPDVLLETLLALDQALKPQAVLANYVFMTRGLPLLPPGTLKLIDTIDVFSTKTAKVEAFGIDDALAMSPVEEGVFLRRADVVLGIQPEESEELSRIAPEVSVLTVGVDMPMPVESSPVAAPVLLLVGSSNPMNVKGLQDFLRFAWPRIRTAIPEARLDVVGSVGDTVPDHVEGVCRLGQIDDLESAYASARIVINPAVAGTGVKIKTLEALSHLKPIVLWPSGVDGIAPALRNFCATVTDWYNFSEKLIELLHHDVVSDHLSQNRVQIERLLSAEVAYGPLADVLSRALMNSTESADAPG